ncbi:MAG TPA: FAD-binding protein [Acidimicrobiales bacterium]|nr:FAD-binding protein [Acidimicrobiales bacterium]
MACRPDGLDVLVVGSGIAGLSAAIELSGQRRVAVVSKESGGGGSTRLAQGGIAAALGAGDTPEAHAADTVRAAAGLGDALVAQAVTDEAAEAVATLARLGAGFDPGSLAKEGGHGTARVVHARGDATGAEITRALLAAAHQRDVPVMPGIFLVDLLISPDGGRVTGALVWDSEEKALRRIYASTVVLATGGYGQLWARTTSPRACSGDGLAAALRAGAQVADLEFVQFHPTGMDLGRDPRPLASEAIRGAGARLRDSEGEHLHGPEGAGDLAPRDVVSRGMARRMAELGTDHCYLDATMLGPDAKAIGARFPTFVAACLSAGLSPDRQWIPVSPTTHYTMGGVLTDSEGRTTLEGLMAVGEVASSGLHGANRLASNSLLEGAVIGRRAAQLIVAAGGPVGPRPVVPLADALGGAGASEHISGHALDRDSLRRAVQAGAGVARDAEGIERLASYLATATPTGPDGPGTWELTNMAQVARVVAALAARRPESRGAHWRTDHPTPRSSWQVRQVVQQLGGELAVGDLAVNEPVPAELPAGRYPAAVGGPTAITG